jgi:Asp-tRNA(Asn)/Glu-tRNA(Gln) amidotransferase C subunit
MALRDQRFCAKHPLQGEIMALSKEDRVRELARLVDIPIMESEIAEVADRLDSLLQELARLTSLDLADIQPVTIFPEEE